MIQLLRQIVIGIRVMLVADSWIDHRVAPDLHRLELCPGWRETRSRCLLVQATLAQPLLQAAFGLPPGEHRHVALNRAISVIELLSVGLLVAHLDFNAAFYVVQVVVSLHLLLQEQ